MLARPRAINASELLASLFSAAGLSCFAGGYPTRAMVADVHPIHQPAQVSLSLSQSSALDQRFPTTRISAQTPAQDTL